MTRAEAVAFAARLWKGPPGDWPHLDPLCICQCAPCTWLRHWPCAACETRRPCVVGELAAAAAQDVPPEQLVLPLDLPRA